MSEIKTHGWLDQYVVGPFEQQQFGTAGVEGVEPHRATQHNSSTQRRVELSVSPAVVPAECKTAYA